MPTQQYYTRRTARHSDPSKEQSKSQTGMIQKWNMAKAFSQEEKENASGLSKEEKEATLPQHWESASGLSQEEKENASGLSQEEKEAA